MALAPGARDTPGAGCRRSAVRAHRLRAHCLRAYCLVVSGGRSRMRRCPSAEARGDVDEMAMRSRPAMRQRVVAPPRGRMSAVMGGRAARHGSVTVGRPRRGEDRRRPGLCSPRSGAAVERTALVAEIIRDGVRRREVLRSYRRLDRPNRQTGQGDGEPGAERQQPGRDKAAPAPAHRWRSFHSPQLIRCSANRSPVPAWRPPSSRRSPLLGRRQRRRPAQHSAKIPPAYPLQAAALATYFSRGDAQHCRLGRTRLPAPARWSRCCRPPLLPWRRACARSSTG